IVDLTLVNQNLRQLRGARKGSIGLDGSLPVDETGFVVVVVIAEAPCHVEVLQPETDGVERAMAARARRTRAMLIVALDFARAFSAAWRFVGVYVGRRWRHRVTHETSSHQDPPLRGARVTELAEGAEHAAV